MRVAPRVLASRGEQATYAALREYFRDRSYVVYKEVKVSQVIVAEKSELTAAEWNYYTRAAFDFVICSESGAQTWDLAIEFDSSLHDQHDRAARDRMKDRLCGTAGLPLLRLRSEHLVERQAMPLLKYMLDLYFGHRSLEQLYEEGLSTEDEYFAGTEFDGTSEIRRRLHARGICPAIVPATMKQDAANLLWYRVRERTLKESSKPGHREYGATIELLRGWGSPHLLFAVRRTVELTNCAPAWNVPGVNGWHIGQELAAYLAYEALEAELVRRVSPRDA